MKTMPAKRRAIHARPRRKTQSAAWAILGGLLVLLLIGSVLAAISGPSSNADQPDFHDQDAADRLRALELREQQRTLDRQREWQSEPDPARRKMLRDRTQYEIDRMHKPAEPGPATFIPATREDAEAYRRDVERAGHERENQTRHGQARRRAQRAAGDVR
jgi:uncharacterized membrane protein YqiK